MKAVEMTEIGGPQPINVGKSILTLTGLRLAAGNVALALLFFAALLPNSQSLVSGMANFIWMLGAVIMGVLSLVRVPPKRVALDPAAFIATAGAMILPAMMRPLLSGGGTIATIGILVECAGIVISQAARFWIGRRFGLLPANRGIVSSGPFRMVRHPIYLGWLVLSLGFGLAYPSFRNWFCLIAAGLFTIWRIVLEERLLSEDPEYRAYCRRVSSRLVPGVI